MEKLKALPKWIKVVFLTMITGVVLAGILNFGFNYKIERGWDSLFYVLVVAIIYYLIIYKPIKFKD